MTPLAHAGAHVEPSALLLLLGTASVVVLVAQSGNLVRHAGSLALVVGGALAFQVFHFVEHIAQLGWWFLHPTSAPWLTPWAEAGRDVLAAIDGSTGSGNELLHLIGNLVFFVGVVAMALLARARGVATGSRALRAALWVQGAHIVEHVALTVSWLIVGKAVGVTTLFGILQPGPALSITRIWAHFTLNAVATGAAVLAARHILDLPRGLRTMHRVQPEPAT